MIQQWQQIQVTDGEPSEPILVVARDLKYVKEWCRIYGINSESLMLIPILHGIDLHGFTDVYYINLGTNDQDLNTMIERLVSMHMLKQLFTPDI